MMVKHEIKELKKLILRSKMWDEEIENIEMCEYRIEGAETDVNKWEQRSLKK